VAKEYRYAFTRLQCDVALDFAGFHFFDRKRATVGGHHVRIGIAAVHYTALQVRSHGSLLGSEQLHDVFAF
jgi:hypothetical protein